MQVFFGGGGVMGEGNGGYESGEGAGPGKVLWDV